MERADDADGRLRIRGQVLYMPMWKKIFFIGCPVLDGLPNLVANSLFINDLSMHDYSRDIMISSSQYKVRVQNGKKNGVTIYICTPGVT